jgi:hypothetical protein
VQNPRRKIERECLRIDSLCEIYFIHIDIVLIIPVHTSKIVPTSRLENLYNARIIHCETGACGHLILEESMNCVTKCVSEECYKEVKYDVNPLEDGEVDINRAMMFAKCVRNELIKERARGRTR